jgi:acyl-CoA synthetase (AMP-forming)/AMP-acid ligase II
MAHLPEGTDPQSGYRSSDRVYYSKWPPVRIPQTPNLDLASFFCAQAHVGDKKALVDALTGRYLTYYSLERDVRALAAGLYRGLGVHQYDVVMLLSPSCIEFPVIFLAVLSLGAVVTTMNPVNTTAEIRRQMKDSGMVHSDHNFFILPKNKLLFFD